MRSLVLIRVAIKKEGNLWALANIKELIRK